MAIDPLPDLNLVRLIEKQLAEYDTPEFRELISTYHVVQKSQNRSTHRRNMLKVAKRHRKKGDRIVPMTRILGAFSRLNLAKPFIKPGHENTPDEPSNTNEAKVDVQKRKDTFKSLRRSGGPKTQPPGSQRQPTAGRSTSHN
jgi:hypothetical protein